MPGGLGLRVSFPQQPVSALVHSFQSHFLLPRFLGDHVTTWKLQVAKLSGVTAHFSMPCEILFTDLHPQ